MALGQLVKETMQELCGIIDYHGFFSQLSSILRNCDEALLHRSPLPIAAQCEAVSDNNTNGQFQGRP